MLAAVFVTGASPRVEVYRNAEFGITVPVPSGTLLCRAPKNEHDHGPVFLLGSSDTNRCHDYDHQRRIDVFASYNAAEDTKTLEKLLKWSCAGFASDEPCRAAPVGLGVPGLRSAAATVDYPDGSIDVIVVTQAGKPDPAFDADVPFVNYQLSLHSGPAHVSADLRVFRQILRTIRLSPPVSPDLKSDRSRP